MATAERQSRIEQILRAARALSGAEQERYLDSACAGDGELRRQVLSRLSWAPPPGSDGLPSTLSLDTPQDMPPDAFGEPRPFHPVGPFQLLESIGRGGMGEVWLVEQTHPIRRRAALKLIKSDFLDNAEVAGRFESERQALAILDHPYIARVFEAGSTPEGRLYYLMEYVPGISITKHCDSHSLGIPERLRLLHQVCEGVQHAHDHGIVHRDLKPSNILVAIRDGVPQPKIIDFGLAKTLAAPLTERPMHTQIGVMMGTPDYMSPEQAGVTAQDIDARTDVYSLGVILYELLTGSRPFDSAVLYEGGYEGARRILQEVEPPLASSKNKALRGDLDRVIQKAMHKDRFRRYGSPMDLAADIQRYLDGAPVQARPSSIGYVAGKYIRRNQMRLMAAALGLAIAIPAIFALRGRVARPPMERSIALLPLKDVAGADGGYLSEGLTEEIFGTLSRNGWRVISARAAERVKDADLRAIGDKLNVRLVLDGRIRRADNPSQPGQVRISLSIEDTADGRLVWTHTFERPMAEAVGVEAEMANAVAAALGVTSGPTPEGSNPGALASGADARCSNADARRAYLEGRRQARLANEAAFSRAAGIFERALQLSPLCSKLWAGLASARQAQADWGGGAGLFDSARKAAQQAVALDPNVAEAHVVLGSLKVSNEWDWAGAETEYRTAARLAPNDSEALFGLAKLVKAQGRLNEALELHQRVASLDPLFTTNLRELGMVLHYMGRHQEAIGYLEKAQALNPGEGGLHAMLSRAYLAMGDAQRALAEADKEPGKSLASEVFRSYTRAMALWTLGREGDSDSELTQLIKKYSKDAPYNIAEAYAHRGDKDAMFQWLNRAIVERDSGLGVEVKSDPLFAPYRVDARFGEVLRKMNQPVR